MLKSGVVVGRLGIFNVGKLRVGKLSGGNELVTEVVKFNPLDVVDILANPLLVLKDGMFNEGNDSGGSDGIESGGKPIDEDIGSPEPKVVVGSVKLGRPWLIGVENELNVGMGGKVDVGKPTGRPGEGIEDPKVGKSAGTAPPGTEVVAEGMP